MENKYKINQYACYIEIQMDDYFPQRIKVKQGRIIKITIKEESVCYVVKMGDHGEKQYFEHQLFANEHSAYEYLQNLIESEKPHYLKEQSE